jgi:hypothetical protein
MFGIQEGFDIVIANPPYVRIHKQDAGSKQLMKSTYKSAMGDYDLYVLFFERGLSLLCEGGILTFITPDKYLVRDYGKELRKIILDYRIVGLLDISRANDAFQAATYPLISIIAKDAPSDKITVTTVNSISNIHDSSQRTLISHAKAKEENIIEIIEPAAANIIDKINKSGVPLSGLIASKQMFCGTPRAKDYKPWGTKVVTDAVQSEEVLPLYVCANIEPYRLNRNKTVRTLGNKVTAPSFDNSSGMIADTRWKDFSHNPKILIRGNDTRITAALDETGSVFVGVYAIKVDENISKIYFSLMAQLNSKLLNWIFKIQNPSVRIGGGFFSINAPQLMKLPIIEPDSNTNIELNGLAQRLHSSAYRDEGEKNALLEKIDKTIFQHYGITEEETKIIHDEV